MASKLKTDWKRIGRSGQTVDGRVIDAEALRQAAKNYDKSLFTALIWPEHERWYNMGTIEELRVEDNAEGGVDLFAIIAPNEYYEQANKAGQKLFTSMELRPNFRDTGEFYLTGCAATDNPASAATAEMRFTASKEPTLLLAQHQELTTQHFTDTSDEQAPSWFTKFFNKPAEADMDKKALAALQLSFSTLQADFAAFTKVEAPTGDAKKGDAIEYASKEAVAELLTKFKALETKLAGDEGHKESDVKFTALQTAFDDLSVKFNAALQEQPGTPAGDHIGDSANASDLM